MVILRRMKMDFYLVFRPLSILLSDQEYNLCFYRLNPIWAFLSLRSPNAYRSLFQVVTPWVAFTTTTVRGLKTPIKAFSNLLSCATHVYGPVTVRDYVQLRPRFGIPTTEVNAFVEPHHLCDFVWSECNLINGGSYNWHNTPAYLPVPTFQLLF